mmetsp:Transcript_46555/g.144250  ORF Transcript_46555/g.144250 Transcript_46555/m.144250 type:complete len:307 (-) Transcript_46555:212-1132(-)
MLLVDFVMCSSPASFSFELSGLIRQKTRIEPLRSSIELWIFFRRFSASSRWLSPTPALVASWIAEPSFSFASRRASMFAMSTPLTSSRALFTLSSAFSFSSSCFNISAASVHSDELSFAASAAWSASRRAWTSRCWQASRSSWRALCFGSSSFSTFSACLIGLPSTPASVACWIAAFSSSMSRLSIAFKRAASASARRSRLALTCSYGTKSAATTPAFAAAAKAAFSSSSDPASLAAARRSFACCFGSSSATTALASSMELLGTLASSAFAMALRSLSKSRSAIACFSFSMALLRFLRSFAQVSAS